MRSAFPLDVGEVEGVHAEEADGRPDGDQLGPTEPDAAGCFVRTVGCGHNLDHLLP